MTETVMKLRTTKNPPETIADHTPKKPYLSPLQQFIAVNCEQCTYYKVKCRLEDSRGLTPMSLCVMLYTNTPESVDDVARILAIMSEKTRAVAESTFRDLKLADMEQSCGGIP